MSEVGVLCRLKLRQLRGMTRTLREQSRLKISVLMIFSLVFWGGMYVLFYFGLRFVEQSLPADLAARVINYLFSLFFFSLFVMLIFSNGIIGYTAIFRNSESTFLYTTPLSQAVVYLYKLVESLVFSSWAFLFIGAPILLAYGMLRGVPWVYYPACLLLILPFVLLPAALGNGAAFALVRYLPRQRKVVAGMLAEALGAGLYLIGRELFSVSRAHTLFNSLGLYQVFSKLAFLQTPLLPSYWMSQGVLLAGRPEMDKLGLVARYFLLLLSNGLLFNWLLLLLAHRQLSRAYSLSQGHGGGRRRYRRFSGRRLIDTLLFFLPRKTRAFIDKDIKNFFRDPVQWSQFLLLFGLLAFYILNLRTLNYDDKNLFWKNIIAFLNLGATALTITTFASRFVFPLLSLEGRRFWVLGVSPIRKSQILLGKFCFSLFGLLLVSETLIVISCYMLKVPLGMALLHCVTMVVICLGISGMAVGLGAIYPNFREDNPSKIVAGFGGTLNLVLSLLFIMLVICLEAIPSHVYFVKQGTSISWIAVPLLLAVVLSAGVCYVPLKLGIRSFQNLDV